MSGNVINFDVLGRRAVGNMHQLIKMASYAEMTIDDLDSAIAIYLRTPQHDKGDVPPCHGCKLTNRVQLSCGMTVWSCVADGGCIHAV